MAPFCFDYASKRREPMVFTQKIPLYIALKLSTVTPSAFSIVIFSCSIAFIRCAPVTHSDANTRFCGRRCWLKGRI